MPSGERWTAKFSEAIGEEGSIAFITGEDITIQLRHGDRDDVEFEFTVLCEAAAPTLMGLSRSDRKGEVIWSRSGSAAGGPRSKLSFFIPNSFRTEASEVEDTWGLSMTSAASPGNSESGIWARWTHSNLRVKWPPPSFSVGSRLSQRYMIDYSIRISARRLLKGGGAKERLPGSDVSLHFKLWSGEPLDHLILASTSPSTTLQPDASISMDAHTKAFHFYLRKLHSFSASREYKMEFLFPEWIILNQPLQIPYKIVALTEVWQSMPRKVKCMVTAWFTEYLDFRLSASNETETKIVHQATKSFHIVHTIDKPVISDRSPRFILMPTEVAPTFSLRDTKSGQASDSFNGEISFYCKVRIVCNIDQKIVGTAPTLSNSWTEGLQMRTVLLPSHYSSLVDAGSFHSAADNLPHRQHQQESSSDAPPPEYDMLSIRTVRTLPRYEE